MRELIPHYVFETHLIKMLFCRTRTNQCHKKKRVIKTHFVRNLVVLYVEDNKIMYNNDLVIFFLNICKKKKQFTVIDVEWVLKLA